MNFRHLLQGRLFMLKMFDRKIMLPFLMTVALFGCSHSGVVDANSSGSGGNVPARLTGVVISTPAVVPVFSGSTTNSGIYIHNLDSDQISSISVSSISNSSTLSSFFTKLLKNMSVADLTNLGFSDASTSTSNGFALDDSSISLCKNLLSQGAGSQCYLRFTTPEVNDPSENGSVMLHVVTTSRKEYSQIVSWSAVASSSNLPMMGFMTELPANVVPGGYATAYVYVGGASPSTVAKLAMSVMPAGSAYVINGYTPNMEVVPGQVVPVEIQISPNSIATSVKDHSKAVSMPDIALFATLSVDGQEMLSSMLNVSLATNGAANLIASNIPTLFTVSSGNLKSSAIVKLYNNGITTANNISITSSSSAAVISADSCTGSPVAAGATCQYTVTSSLVGATALGTTSVTVSYSYTSADSSSVLAIPGSTFNVVDNRQIGSYVSYTLPGKQMVAINKGIANESAVFVLSVFNSSASAESVNITVGALSMTGDTSALSESISSTTCGTLQIGSNCAITVAIASISPTLTTSGYVTQALTYNTNNRPTPISQMTLSVPYQVYGDPYLVFSPMSGYAAISGMNTTESDSVVVVVTNSGVESALLTSIPVGVPTTSNIVLSSNTCLSGNFLAAGATCTFTAKLGPLGVTQNTYTFGTESFYLSYANGVIQSRNVTYNTTMFFSLYWQIFGQYGNLTLVNVESYPAQTSGVGTIASPMMYTGGNATSGVQKVILTYQNNSTLYRVESQVFNIAGMPSFYSVESTSTCGYESNGGLVMKIIESGGTQTCKLNLLINRESMIAAFANSSGVTTMDFKYPLATWKSVTESGYLPESMDIYLAGNGESWFRGSYQSAVLTTTESVASSNWLSAVFTQTITNESGYPSGLVNLATYAWNSWGYTESGFSSNCSQSSTVATLESQAVLESITCTFLPTKTGSWTVLIKESDPLIYGGMTLATYLQESISPSYKYPVVANPVKFIFTRN